MDVITCSLFENPLDFFVRFQEKAVGGRKSIEDAEVLKCEILF